MILVKAYWNTEADGTPVPENTPDEDRPISYYGPFDSIEDAESWMNYDYPDGDTDLYEMEADDYAIPANEVQYVNSPDSIQGDIPDEDIRELTEEEEHDLGPRS